MKGHTYCYAYLMPRMEIIFLCYNFRWDATWSKTNWSWLTNLIEAHYLLTALLTVVCQLSSSLVLNQLDSSDPIIVLGDEFNWGIGVYTLILISNGDFAPLFRTLWIYPCYLKLKTQFCPTPWSSFNGVNLVAKRPSCPCNFAPTCFLNLCFYPYFITHNTTGLSKQYTHV